MRVPFLPRPGGSGGPHDLVPLLSFVLSSGAKTVPLTGIVDSGASFSVLPFDIGKQFGFDWHSLTQPLQIGGAGGRVPAKIIRLTATVGQFSPVSMIFAWVTTNSYPIVLGEMSFFYEFDVFLSRRHSYFEIQPATP